MKKPVILLVDDDSSVLEALEAALVPAFGEIARVEAFADPSEVLAEMPRWATEERRIAVAVVDQKMPGMTGVDLLSRLRAGLRTGGDESGGEFDPTGSMGAILLTGYAGLDSALESKNVAGTDRYVEKPWSGEALREHVRVLLADHLTQCGVDQHYVFRQVTTPDELRALFRLRYEVYRQSGLGDFCHPEPSGMDIDAYDIRAHHLGLFLLRGDCSRLVGSLRIVSPAGATVEAVSQIADAVPELAAKLGNNLELPFPVMTYFPDVEPIRDLWKRCEERGEPLSEPGRLALAPEARTRGVARHVIGSTVAYYYYYYGLDNAVLSCVPLHKGIYARFGFRRLDGTGDCYIREIRELSCCLVGARRWVPSPAKERVETFADRLRSKGHTCYCTTFPRCLHEPYAAGDFGGIDLFCPHRANEILRTSGVRPSENSSQDTDR